MRTVATDFAQFKLLRYSGAVVRGEPS